MQGPRRVLRVELHPDGQVFVWESTAWRYRSPGDEAINWQATLDPYYVSEGS
jgi:hypothetical protein